MAFQNFDANISGWITSQVTNMNCMFYRAYSFNHSLAFDTGKVTTMSSMFYECEVKGKFSSVGTGVGGILGGCRWEM